MSRNEKGGLFEAFKRCSAFDDDEHQSGTLDFRARKFMFRFDSPDPEAPKRYMTVALAGELE